MVRKIVWTGLVTVLSAVSAALAVRAAERLWWACKHQPPPEIPTWAKLLLGKPLKKGVEARVAEVPI